MSEPGVDAEDVRHVATLARIDLEADEIEEFREDFADILEYFERLEEVPDVEVDEEIDNVLRPDEIEESLSAEEALANAAAREDGYFKGPPVG